MIGNTVVRYRIIERLLSTSGAVVLCAFLSSAAFGQEYRGRIQGGVMDSSQAVIAGATVTLLNGKTGISTVQLTVENGRYLFDLVEPGTYRITVEVQGFNKFVLDNLAVPSRADLTVDAILKPGDISETVTVVAETATPQFNTSNLETNVNQRLVDSLPQLYRNPFLLAQLDPAVEFSTWGGEEPYSSWASNNQRIGGSLWFTNDLQVDGSPSGISVKTGYVPTPGMVQEVNIQQNVVDAEFGHSSGSAISIVLKAGTNEYHGMAFYQGQYPWLNAIENRVYRTANQIRNHMYGGTFSNPIFKNKLFNFASYEGWNQTEPGMLKSMLPTDLQRQGDFSQTLTDTGQLRVIYDPWSTTTAPDGTITRTPFPNNKIPSSRIDPIAAEYLAALWKPNNPGIDAYGTNNFVAPIPLKFPYKNFSDRVDYQVSEKLRLFGRVSLFRTISRETDNPTGSELYKTDRGSDRNATSYAGDATYAINPKTVLNLHGGYHNFVDASHSITDFPDTWSWENLWPNSDFYQTVFADPNIPKQLPRMSVCNQYNFPCTTMGPAGGLWNERPHAWEFSGKLTQQRGSHYLKAGADIRRSTTNSLIVLVNPGFGFDGKPTSETYNNPNLLNSGDPYATFLLGAISPTDLASWDSNGNFWDSGATAFPINIVPSIQSRFYGVYLNDDWKVTKNLTLNLGLRYEYESPFHDEQYRETRALDLNAPIPELQGITMPDEVKQFYSGSWKMTGAFQFADDQHPGAWDAGWGTFSPRIGAAYRLNDKTAIRGAYGRYVTPWTSNSEHDQLNGTGLYGFSNFTGAPGEIYGVPQMQLSNPFPASNPVAPSYGKSLGIYTMLGDSIHYFSPDRRRSNSDRLNISVQRQLPGSTVLDITYYLNLTSQVTNTSYNINQVDPEINHTYKEEALAVMPNPFYNQFPVEKFPGPLRYQPEVEAASMAKPYPQYGDIYVTDAFKGGAVRYQALQIRLNKSYAGGLSLLGGYSYNREKYEDFYDEIADYNRNFSWQNSYTCRHRLTAAGTWDLPIGKGRAFLTNAPWLLDAVLGGWKVSSMLFWRSGDLLWFDTMLWDGTDPRISDPGPQGWFNTAVFQMQPTYEKRSNPWDFAGVTGPGQFNMDVSLMKEFKITEKVRFQMKLDSFNVMNNISWNNPSTSVTDPNFGISTDQKEGTFGRRTQLGMRLEF
jgi:hypothetical protein